jgi:HEAT repeat protein
VRLVGRLDADEAHALCVQLLADADAEVRGAALDALVHHERRDLAQAMLDRSLGAPGFSSFAVQEKRRLFRAVAKLAGDQALVWFVACLERRESGWFEGTGARELREAAAHGIRRIGTEASRARLVELSRSKDRHVRAACLKELAEEEA